jgi:hypothetical protein
LSLLDNVLDGDLSPILKLEFLEVTSALLWTGSMLARYAPPVDAIIREQKRWQAARGRQSKKNRDAVKDARLRQAIIVVAKGSELVASWSYAESIHDGVRKQLGITSGSWPSTRTIQRRISAILKERRKS